MLVKVFIGCYKKQAVTQKTRTDMIMSKERKKIGRPQKTLTPEEIRERDMVQLGLRFFGEDKNFLADVLQEEQQRFNATAHDVVTMLVREARTRRLQVQAA